MFAFAFVVACHSTGRESKPRDSDGGDVSGISAPPFKDPGQAMNPRRSGITPAHRIAMPKDSLRVAPDNKSLLSDTCEGHTAQLISLRGWLDVYGGNNEDNEVHYRFEVDIADAISRGQDPASFIHWANAYQRCENHNNTSLPVDDPDCRSNGTWWAIAAPANIHVELVGWNETRNTAHPSLFRCPDADPKTGWVLTTDVVGNDRVWFPFDPKDPVGAGSASQGYVQMEGSLIADTSHCKDDPTALKHVKEFWGKLPFCNDLTGFGDQSRWVEIHPPDRITAVLEPSGTMTSRWWIVAVATPYHDQEWIGVLTPRGGRPGADYLIEYEEHVLQRERPEDLSVLYDRMADGVRVHASGRKGGTLGSEYLDGPRYLALVRVGYRACTRYCEAGSCGSDGCEGTCRCESGKHCSNGRCCPPGKTWEDGQCIKKVGCPPDQQDCPCVGCFTRRKPCPSIHCER